MDRALEEIKVEGFCASDSEELSDGELEQAAAFSGIAQMKLISL